ncbi:Ras- protein Rab-40C [Periplaneta americana]|uniref:Ras- protein Rab-40C n=1 Tax=Periplaneta americana TaxID=6978 RepID=A0ABQ8T9P1_PERAM|nr:Ras- protein Rab-40C [Periplaneta americana]
MPCQTKETKDCVMALEPRPTSQQKQYDYLLKFLLVGDSDVGKQEILSGLEDGSSESPFCSGGAYKTTTILLDGKRVKLQLWDTSGQGRFCTIIRSYSRGAQGILLVYDITNKWSFDGIDRWLKEVEEHAPGVPKVLVGNRLHLAFKRQVGAREAEAYAAKNRMAFFEVSPLCDFNIRESFSELSRMALHRNGMERLWRSNKGEPELPEKTLVLPGLRACPTQVVNQGYTGDRTRVHRITRLQKKRSVQARKKLHFVPEDQLDKDEDNISVSTEGATLLV